jgi:hypothetical protein
MVRLPRKFLALALVVLVLAIAAVGWLGFATARAY